MRWPSRFLTPMIAVVLITLSGCGPSLNDTRTVNLVPGTANERITYEAPLVDKATVVVKAPGAQVNAYLVLQSNLESAIAALDRGQTPKDVLGFKEKTEEAKFDIAPGKKPFILILTSTGKKAEVQVTTTGK